MNIRIIELIRWIMRNENRVVELRKDGYSVDNDVASFNVTERNEDMDMFLFDSYGIGEEGKTYRIEVVDNEDKVTEVEEEPQWKFMQRNIPELEKGTAIVPYKRFNVHSRDDEIPENILSIYQSEKGDIKIVDLSHINILKDNETGVSAEGPFPLVFGDCEAVILPKIDIIESSMIEDLNDDVAKLTKAFNDKKR